MINIRRKTRKNAENWARVTSPSYLRLYRSGELAARAWRAQEIMENCRLCPRACGVHRLSGELGFCRSGVQPRVYKYKVHFGEEPPISGRRGSGIIFFSCCTLRCTYCQNAPMSHQGRGYSVSPERLAKIMLALQHSGCHNLNLVTPSHFLPGILQALNLAVGEGFVLPIVYNTGGYETLEVLNLLDGIVDIYLPDMKYGNADVAGRYSSAPDYPRVNRAAVREMYRQVADLLVDDSGVAVHGLLIRHLVLPNGLAGTGEVMRFIGQEISRRVHVSLMSQYIPLWSAREDPLLNRPISQTEYRQALDELEKAGLVRGWIQELAEKSLGS